MTIPLGEETTRVLAQWFENGRPAVARRPCCRTAPSTVSLGIAFPPSRWRIRTAFSVHRGAISSVDPPPLLRHVIGCAPRGWRRSLTALDEEAMSKGLCFHVFGSLAWQFFTSMRYVTARSDVDLLFYPRSQAALDAGVSLLSRWETSRHLRADGEIVLPDGRAIAWREWTQQTSLVLTKHRDGVALTPRSELCGAFCS